MWSGRDPPLRRRRRRHRHRRSPAHETAPSPAGIASFHHHDPARAHDRLLPVIESPDARPEVVGEAALVLAPRRVPAHRRCRARRSHPGRPALRVRRHHGRRRRGSRGSTRWLSRSSRRPRREPARAGGGEAAGRRGPADRPGPDRRRVSGVEFSAGLVHLTGLDTAPAPDFSTRSSTHSALRRPVARVVGSRAYGICHHAVRRHAGGHHGSPVRSSCSNRSASGRSCH